MAKSGKEVHKQTILYKHLDLFKPKNAKKPSNSAQIQCQWHVNLSRSSKSNDDFYVFVTTLNNNHNHDLSPKVIQFEKNKQFTEEIDVSSMTNATTIFPSIESLAKCYLRPNVANFLVKQMKESLYYTASCAIVKEIESLTSYEPSQSEDIDDKPNVIVLCAIYLLEHLERILIHIWLQPFDNSETEEITNDDFIDKMLFYKKAWGLAHTAINKCIKEKLVRSQEEVVALTSQNVAKSTKDSMIQLENPRKVVGRGSPKAASHHNKDITNVTSQET
ncbi:4131_t:CDS:2, partial [Cetraspora pellucida]